MEIRASNDNQTRLVMIGRETEIEVIQEAFRLWIENGRSTRVVAQTLGCDQRTVQRWAKDNQWEIRRIEQAQSFLPGARAETAFALKLAAHNAAIRLQQIAFDAAETGQAPNVKEVQALALIVDRGGYSPTGNKSPLDGSEIGSSDVIDAPALRGLTPEDLMKLEDRSRSKRNKDRDQLLTERKTEERRQP